MQKNKDQASLDEIKSFYDNVYYKNSSEVKTANRHLFNLAKKLGVGESQQILDVACGTGEWLFVCQHMSASCSGVDLSERAIENCRKSMPEGEFYAQPAEVLPFVDRRFDVVTCLGSLEHFVRPDDALKEMVRVAKPDARVVILVPNADFLTRKLGLYKGTYQVDAKEEVRSLEAWGQLFADAGLEVESRWKDLHVISLDWICLGKWYGWPIRAIQALLLAIWPLRWQYQVYHLCRIRSAAPAS